MKKVILTTIFATLMICSSLFYVSCNKEGTSNSNDLHKNLSQNNKISHLTPVAHSDNEIENQIRWIAKGYAFIYVNNSNILFDFLNAHLKLNENYEDAHQSVNPESLIQIFMDLDDSVFNAVNFIDSNNDYNRNYFM